ncbi:MAG: hypothetical protein HY722_12610, partial [Planctomycetes bacterium]|nr:hypothetical protein [Planctomycetota bacterium]
TPTSTPTRTPTPARTPPPEPSPELAPTPEPTPAPVEPTPLPSTGEPPPDWPSRQRAFAAAYDDPDPHRRARAVLGLEDPGHLPLARLLLKLLRDPAAVVRLAALEVLGTLRDSVTLAWLATEGIAGTRGEARLDLVESLARAGERRVVPVALELLENEHLLVRGRAARALGLVPDAASVGPLIHALEKAEGADGHEAALALYRITGQDLGSDVAAWTIWWSAAAGAFAAPARPHDPCERPEEEPGGTRTGGPTLAGYGPRVGRGRTIALARHGGDGQTEGAVATGLDWLARHQEPDGGWGADSTGRCDARRGPPCEGKGSAGNGPAFAGLALLAFLGAGHTHLHGDYQPTVQAGLEHLKRVQETDGRLSGNMYHHGIASFALAEAYGLTRDCEIRDAAQRAVDFICAAQHPGSGWDYGPFSPSRSDLSVSGWQILALKAARAAGLRVPLAVWLDVSLYLDKATRGRGHQFRVAYAIREPEAAQEGPAPAVDGEGLTAFEEGGIGMVAAATACRLYLGEGAEGPEVQDGLRALQLQLPGPREVHRYYWYYGTLAAFRQGGRAWDRWNECLKRCLTPTQEVVGCRRGSWPADGTYGPQGGRVYTTALGVIMLEVYYRYDAE